VPVQNCEVCDQDNARAYEPSHTARRMIAVLFVCIVWKLGKQTGGRSCRSDGRSIVASRSRLTKRNTGNNTAKNVLVTYDFAKCRGGLGDDHAPELGVASSNPATPTNT
jgi:hypothetical protein